MTSPPNTQLPAGDGNKHGWGAGISLGVIGLAMIVLLVLPGFMAAGFSRWESSGSRFVAYSRLGEVNWDDNFGGVPRPGSVRAELALLSPSGWVMGHSQLARQFYSWQYQLAGGREASIRD